VAVRCNLRTKFRHNYQIPTQQMPFARSKCTKVRPRPRWGAYEVPPHTLVGWARNSFHLDDPRAPHFFFYKLSNGHGYGRTHLGRCKCLVPAGSLHRTRSSSYHTYRHNTVNILRCYAGIRSPDRSLQYLTNSYIASQTPLQLLTLTA